VANSVSQRRALLEEIREQVQGSATQEPGGTAPADVQDQIDSAQSDLNDAAQQIPVVDNAPEEPVVAPPPPEGSVRSTQVTVTGTGAGATGTVREDAAALAASEVARDAGLETVRFGEADADSVFRFTDSGNGFVTVTRYDVTAGELTETGSETVALQNFRNGSMAGGASETLSFGRLGLQVDIGTDYTPGDLNRVDVRVQTPETGGGEAPVSVADTSSDETGIETGYTLEADVTQQLAALIDLADRLTTEAQTSERYANQDFASALNEIAAAGPAALGIDSQSFERQLRAALLTTLTD